jgi:hypothetical protein
MTRAAHNRLDLTGQRFGRLVALRQVASREHGGQKFGYWLCRCDCGNETEVMTANLKKGNTKSCGCLNLELARERFREIATPFTHGRNMRDRTYASWSSMLRRVRHGELYIERGISVDPKWLKFENFLADMGERPDGMTIDRIDNDGPYAPGNCRWASPEVQMSNRSNTRNLTYEGRTQSVAQWAREFGLNRNVLFNRITIYGWDTERALKTPPRPQAPRRAPAVP